jgi:hypothetical protein
MKFEMRFQLRIASNLEEKGSKITPRDSQNVINYNFHYINIKHLLPRYEMEKKKSFNFLLSFESFLTVYRRKGNRSDFD